MKIETIQDLLNYADKRKIGPIAVTVWGIGQYHITVLECQLWNLRRRWRVRQMAREVRKLVPMGMDVQVGIHRKNGAGQRARDKIRRFGSKYYNPNLQLYGFAKHKVGFAHMRCPDCGRKMSNRAPLTGDEPEGTVLIETPCLECAHKAMEPDERYFDERGREIRRREI